MVLLFYNIFVLVQDESDDSEIISSSINESVDQNNSQLTTSTVGNSSKLFTNSTLDKPQDNVQLKNINKDDNTKPDVNRSQNSISSDSEEDNSLIRVKNTVKSNEPKKSKSPGLKLIQKSIRVSSYKEATSQDEDESFIGHRKARAIIESDSEDEVILPNVSKEKPDNLSSEEESLQQEQLNNQADDVLNISTKLNRTKLDTGK